MDLSSVHDTDGSSIKPVSSLRSHFEKLQGSDTGNLNYQTRSSRHLTQRFQNETYLRSEHILQSRQSIDTVQPEHRYPVHNNPEQPVLSSLQDSLTVTSKLGEPHLASQILRPKSIGHLSPPVSPPSVVIDSPFNPTLQDEYCESTEIAVPTTRQYISSFNRTSGGTRTVVDKNEHYLSQTVKPPFRNITASPTNIKNNLKSDSTDIGRTQTIPPPVNRARKPKTFSKPLDIDHRNLSDRLSPEPKNITSNDKISPFSTPPSSDDNTIADDSPTQDREHIWQNSIHEAKKNDQCDQKKAYNVNTGGLRHPPVFRKGREESDTDLDDFQPERPSLPPRKDVKAVRAGMETINRPLIARSSNSNTPQGIRHVDDILSHSTSNKGIPSRFHTVVHSHQIKEQDNERHSVSLIRGSAVKDIKSDQLRGDSEEVQEQQHEPRTSTSSRFPDATNANRRPPRFSERPWEINTGYDTKVFALCGEYLCTTGFITRAWNVRTGQMLVDITHQDTTKVTAIAFRPAPNANSEGNCVWLGTNGGDILEVDIPTGSIINTNGKAHNRKEILKIFRYGSNMWSLDEDGKLNIWRPDSHGDIDLPCTPYASRVPKGHTFSLVASGELWIASGKDIRIFRPEKEEVTDFTVLKHPLSQAHIGEITSGAIIPSQHDRVYFGHADGKISIYSSKQYCCINVVNLSLYKISSLAGVGDYLWAGFYTGMIYVYDTTKDPWRVMKDWTAHQNHRIAGIIIDRSSVWKMNRLQVASLGTDNVVRIWDGMLRADWLENALHQRADEYCDFKDFSALILSWNAGAAKPNHIEHDRHDARFFEEFLQLHDPPDIIVFGFQELVDLEGKKTTALSLFKSKKKDPSEHDHMRHQYRIWIEYLTRCLDTYLPTNHAYTLLHTGTLVGLFSCIFVKGSLRSRIRNVNLAEIKCGMGGLHGNKGALITRFIIDDTSICLINCHLAAGQKHTIQRNNDIANILESEALPEFADSLFQANWCVNGGNGTMIIDHEVCILNGDLNYRIDVIGRDSVLRAIRENNLPRLLERDQLLVSRKMNPGFRLRAFQEAPITFAPTYKYDVASNQYDTSDKKRAPAWCDRILYRGPRIEQLTYQRRDLRASDHRPVSALFKFRVKNISEKQQESTWKQCEEDFESVKARIAMETNLDYLVQTFGLSVQEAKRLLAE